MVVAFSSHAVLSCSDTNCAETATCATGSGNFNDGGNLDGGDRNPGGDDVVPPGCDYAADPKDSPACVVDDGGIFVDKAGSDSDPGTKTKPKQSISAAVGTLGNGKARVFVCGEGPFEEKIKITANASIFGGFECVTWKYIGTRAKVVPTETGYVVEVSEVASTITLADLDLSAKAGAQPGESSVALFAMRSGAVTLRRMRIQAGAGQNAPPVDSTPSNHFGATNGNSGSSSKICTCPTHGRSLGGGGGAGGNPATGGGTGSATPPVSVMAQRTSQGGDGYPVAAGACSSGKSGSDGIPRNGGSGADSFGDLAPTGFVGKPGRPGETGNPGAGGGGGGGGIASSGGGGACGGCGGGGGLGGLAGGSSIAVLALETLVVTQGGDLLTGNGGDGAAGGMGQIGEAGGSPGAAGGGDACGGGYGGNGAGGGAGGGGAGGLSVGILFKGAPPTLDPATGANLGSAGSGGSPGGAGAGGTNILGTAPAGGAGTKGKDGVKALQQSL